MDEKDDVFVLLKGEDDEVEKREVVAGSDE